MRELKEAPRSMLKFEGSPSDVGAQIWERMCNPAVRAVTGRPERERAQLYAGILMAAMDTPALPAGAVICGRGSSRRCGAVAAVRGHASRSGLRAHPRSQVAGADAGAARAQLHQARKRRIARGLAVDRCGAQAGHRCSGAQRQQRVGDRGCVEWLIALAVARGLDETGLHGGHRG